LSYLINKKILTFFYGKGPVGQKLTKIFNQRDMTIHTPFESPCRV
jgi:hypothetical protein